VSETGATVVVVPCFNEEHRLDEKAFAALAAGGRLRLLFVDDGSSDGTGEVLGRMAEGCPGVEVLSLGANGGKAEAVRRGMQRAVAGGAEVVAYYDADMATPPDELERLVGVLRAHDDLVGVFGSRVARLGSIIERRALRHYLGRIYATLASYALGISVYDTQCGAKVFRVDARLARALTTPFRSSWAFDVELLHRLLVGGQGVDPVPVGALLEVPLTAWRDVSGSKLRLGAALRALGELASVARRRPRP